MARKRKSSAKRRKALSRLNLRKEVRAVGTRLDRLMAEARKAEKSARATAVRDLQLLKRKQAAANRALAKLGRQSAAASAPLVAGMQKAWHDMELAVRQANKRFRQTS
jgi:transposase InsO family protein